jgi:uncharacterized membrane protein
MDTETIPEIVQRALDPDFSMGWDLFLAGVPLALAFVLFRRARSRGPVWWAGLALFVLFLPNAAYPLTDFLHFVLKIRQRPYLPAWAVGLLVIPEYLVYIGASFLAYVLSLRFLGDYLRSHGKVRLVAPVELVLHGLCALGIYLGRMPRLNSWDVLTRPATVLEKSAGALDQPKSVLFIAITAVVVAAAYYPARSLVDALRRGHSAAPPRHELIGLLERNGYEVGRDAEGRLFLSRKGLDWPPQARIRGLRRSHS